MSTIILTIFYITLMFLAIPRSVDAFEEGKKLTGSILLFAAWTFGLLSAIGINILLMQMGI